MPSRQKCDEKATEEVMLQTRLGNMGLWKAAKHYQIPKSTLSDRVAGKYKMGSKPARPPKLSHDDEDKLINHAIERAKLGIGFSKQNFLKCAGDLAIKRKQPFKNKSPSDKWWRLMKKRTNKDFISLRSPEGTTGLRHKGMSKARVSSFFNALQDTLQKTGIKDSSYIWNMDETGLQLAHRPSCKVK
jgi:hypothetical protein